MLPIVRNNTVNNSELYLECSYNVDFHAFMENMFASFGITADAYSVFNVQPIYLEYQQTDSAHINEKLTDLLEEAKLLLKM